MIENNTEKNNAVQVRFKIKITNLIKGTVAQDEIGLESVGWLDRR